MSFVASSISTQVDASTSLGLKHALDAAIVRTIRNGDYASMEARWSINTIASFTCTPEPDWFAFPEAAKAAGALRAVIDGRKLKLASLGPSDWGTDGDYTVNPPVGFWPDYERAVLGQLRLAYGDDLEIERVFFSDSNALLASLQAGETHASGPYYVAGGAVNGTSRQAVLR